MKPKRKKYRETRYFHFEDGETTDTCGGHWTKTILTCVDELDKLKKFEIRKCVIQEL